MELPKPEPGLVIRYGFVWRSEADKRPEPAGKSRPCAIVVAAKTEKDSMVVTVVPITHTRPLPEANAFEIPPAVKVRLGLDEQQSWIITHELNTFRWPGVDLEIVDGSDPPGFAYGHLPKKLYFAVLGAVRAHIRAGGASLVKRTE